MLHDLVFFATKHHGEFPPARLMKQTPTLRSERELTCHSVSVVTPGTGGQRAIWCRVAWPPSMSSQTDRHYGRSDVLDTEPYRRGLIWKISRNGRFMFLLVRPTVTAADQAIMCSTSSIEGTWPASTEGRRDTCSSHPHIVCGRPGMTVSW